MKSSMGDSLAEYGFSFFEKLHSPIFLLHKNGTLKKVNEAGRKLISIAHLTGKDVEAVLQSLVRPKSEPHSVDYIVFRSQRTQLKLVSNHLGSSDYLLVELIR